MKCDHICTECGKHEDGGWLDDTAKKLTANKLCFQCDHWTDLVGLVDGPSVARIDGKHYMVGKPTSNKAMAGFGGHRFDIEFNDGRKVTTNNLWHQGTIPERFRDRLPDNACFARSQSGSVNEAKG